MSKPNTYKKKPVVIQALVWEATKTSWDSMSEFITDPRLMSPGELGSESFLIKTLEGDMKVSKGDYVIRGVEGEFYPCKPSIFNATYERV